MSCPRVPLLAIAAWALSTPAPSPAQIPYWDLTDVNAPGQITFYNPDAYDANNGVPVRVVDLNGDGRGEVIVSAFNGDGPAEGPVRDRAGEIHIFFYDDRPLTGYVDFRKPQSSVLEVLGETSENWFGCALAGGDLNGDGIDDLVVGAMGAGEPATHFRAGKVFVLFGDPGLGGGSRLDLGAGLPPNMTQVIGRQPDDRLGVWSAVGDVDGDGWNDLVMGSDRADGFADGTPQAGEVVVLYGPIHAGATIDLADTILRQTVVYGVDVNDHFGATVTCADLDGDGYAEIVGAAASHGLSRNVFDNGGSGDGPPGQLRQDSGETFIIWGAPDLPAEIQPLAPPPGVETTEIYGKHNEARCGEELDWGDVNGDGLTDLLVGSLTADGPSDDYRRNAGIGYVFYGDAALRGQVYDMASDPVPGVTIYGVRESIATDSYAAGDINGDGYSDVLVGMPHDPGPSDRRAGTIAVVYGGPSLPAEIDLADPQVPISLLDGVDPFDDTAYWAHAGDVDGDGFDDVLVNAMSGAGYRNSRPTCGDARVVSGAWLCHHPEPPTGVVLQSLDDGRNLEVTWESSPTPGVSAYRVHHGATALVDAGTILVPAGSGNRTLIRDVIPHSPCYVRVDAVMSGFQSRPTDPMVLRTGTLETPVPTVTVNSPTHVSLSWAPVDDPNLLGYSVYRSLCADPPTAEDRITDILTEPFFEDVATPDHVKVYYWVTTWHQGMLESNLLEPVGVWTLPQEVGQGTLLINDYNWFKTSDGPYPNWPGDPYEFYESEALTGSLDADFWDMRTGWSLYPPNLNVLGTGTVPGNIIFQYGLVIVSHHSRDNFKDDRFRDMEELLIEYMDRGGVLAVTGWQMGEFVSPLMRDALGVDDWSRPRTVTVSSELLSTRAGFPDVGPNPQTGTAAFCDVPEFDGSGTTRVLLALDPIKRYPVFFSVGSIEETERAFVLSASPSHLDPDDVRDGIAPYFESVAGAHTQIGVPDIGPTFARLGLAYPNPSRGAVQVDLQLDAPSVVESRVVDVSGRLVRTLTRELPGGPSRIVWDGRDDQGRRAAAGVYLLRVVTPEMTGTRRILLIP